MNKISLFAKTLPIAAAVAFFATRWVHGRFGNETFICADGIECELGSGLSWILTGITAVGPFIALAAFHWTRRLHQQGRLGPFSERAIPDIEQILEIAMFVGAVAATYWLALNGPSIESVEISGPNAWAEWLRDFRAPEALTPDDRQKLQEVPSRRTWFVIGTLLGAPAWMAFGTMLGREWYGRQRRKAQRAEDTATEDDEPIIDLSASESRSTDIDLTTPGLATD